MGAIDMLVNQVIPKLIERIKALEAKQATLDAQVAELFAEVAKKPATRKRGSKKDAEEATAPAATGWTSTAKDPCESVVDMGLVAELDKKYADTPPAPAQEAPLDVRFQVGEFIYKLDQPAIDNARAALIANQGNLEATAAALQVPIEYVQEAARIAIEQKQKQQGEQVHGI